MREAGFGGKRRGLAALLVGAAVAALAAAAPTPWVVSPADWARFSVLTPPGPEEPAPAVLRRIKRLVYAQHKIGRGEYSESLAKAYGTTVMSLQSTNDNELLYPRPGMRIMVHNKSGQLYEVRKASETLNQIVRKYHRDRTQAEKFKELIVSANRLPGIALLGDYEFSKGSRVLLPKVTVTFDTYRFPFASLAWPRISSGFGLRYHPILHRKRFHDGFDIPKPYGTAVFPARSGKVVEAGWSEGYGMLIVIRHSDGATTRYGHLSRIDVKRGDAVQRGRTLIGRVGSTGLSTGPHLHFEVRDKNGHPVNPATKIGRR